MKQLVIAAAIAMAASATQANLIQNGGFEQGLDHWRTTNAIGGGVDIVEEAGNHYARISDPSSFGWEALAQDFYIPADTGSIDVSFRYNFDVHYDNSKKIDDTAISKLLTAQHSISDAVQVLSFDTSADGDTGWVNFSATYDVSNIWDFSPNAAIEFNIWELRRLLSDPTDSAFYVDDVVIAKTMSVPEPGSLALLAAGLLGLSYRRRQQA